MAYVEDGKAAKAFRCRQDKKNVFLIGDSIRQGYCRTVKEALSDVAEVFFVEENCRSTQFVITSLYSWANCFDAPEQVDLVQFNCGHWDIAHWSGYELPLTSEAEYARNIKMIIALIRKLFVNAKILFVTTTPMNPDGTLGVNVRTNTEIEQYNTIAVKTSQEAGIFVSDLYAFTKDWDPAQYADYCHFTKDANKILGEEVARRLEKLLGS